MTILAETFVVWLLALLSPWYYRGWKTVAGIAVVTVIVHQYRKHLRRRPLPRDER